MSGRIILVLMTALLIAGCAVGPATNIATTNADAGPVRLGPTARDEEVGFTLSLNLRDEQGLEAFLAGLNEPTSSHYQRFLSAADFGERFGLPQQAIDRVVSWLDSAGLEASAVPQRTSVAVSGTAAAVNTALEVKLVD